MGQVAARTRCTALVPRLSHRVVLPAHADVVASLRRRRQRNAAHVRDYSYIQKHAGYCFCIWCFSLVHVEPAQAYANPVAAPASRSIDLLVCKRTCADTFAATHAFIAVSITYLCIRKSCRRFKVRCKLHPPMPRVDALVVTGNAAAEACLPAA